MLKTKRFNIVLVAIVMFSMVAMYGYMPTVDAASLDSVSVKLGDSDTNQTATSTVTVDLGTALTSGQYIRVSFVNTFSGVTDAAVVCPNSSVASTTDTATLVEVDCTAGGGGIPNTPGEEIKIQVTNPGTVGAKDITISTHEVGGTEIESSQVKVFIISDVDVTAHVDATLTFQITGTTTGAVINGATTTIDTSASATSLPFGDLTVGSTTILAQDLAVTTNAGSGFTVTVAQDGDLVNAAANTINAFDDGVVPGAGGAAWSSPATTVGNEDTYGHMGLTVSDYDDVTAVGAATYTGLSGTTAQEVMSHTSVANGTGDGKASVAYAIEISSLQEAGDYTSTLTYVCTPTY